MISCNIALQATTLHSSVQQMMTGNTNWKNVHPPSMIFSPFVLGSPSLSLNSLTDSQETAAQTWSQMLLTGIPIEEDRTGLSHFQTKKLEHWDDQILNPAAARVSVLDVIKQEASHSNSLYGYGHEEFQASGPVWSHSHIMPVSAPRSCVTNLSNKVLDFSYNNADSRNYLPDHASECNSAAKATVCKKARVQPSSSQPPLKVRKEKLGDRITVLHQLVSPFGKTDTASVLLEANGYIRFLQGQIEALSSPYLGNASKNIRNQQSSNGERNCVFPEDPGQLLNDTFLKRKAAPNQDTQNEPKVKDLRSRGLCLVPVSCTQNVRSDNGADYWAPAYDGGF